MDNLNFRGVPHFEAKPHAAYMVGHFKLNLSHFQKGIMCVCVRVCGLIQPLFGF